MADIDLTLCEALVEEEGEGGRRRGVILKRQDCSDALQRIASLDDGVFWIECELETGLGRCLGMRLCVDAARLDARLQRNGVASEEFVVQLARAVWRESMVPVPQPPDADAQVPLVVLPPRWRADDLPLRPHQQRTLQWMRAQEARFPCSFRYDGNIRVGRRGTWYIDTERECITPVASPREAELRGGICTDAPGSGKTATAIALMLGDSNYEEVAGAPPPLYASRASLVIAPLNLTSQWLHEIDKFTVGTRVLTMMSARDLRAADMRSICADFDVVLTNTQGSSSLLACSTRFPSWCDKRSWPNTSARADCTSPRCA